MQILGFILAGLVGVSLGLIGGGGSILTVPILVYVLGLNPILATSYSLFIVGSTSVVGAFHNYRSGLVSIKTAMLIGLSSILTVFIIRRLVMPEIPDQFFSIGSIQITQSLVTMIFFAVLMLFAAISMIKGRSEKNDIVISRKHQKPAILKLLLYGVLIGMATGFLGAGGGFLLIPVLVLFLKMPMKMAVGTSLLIIALNPLIGFTGDIGHFLIDWKFLISITAIAIAGVFLGGILSKKIEGEKLKKAFGWFVLVIGLVIIVRELFLLKH
jgi:uncharacterized membrane protein YfcA